jgi:hypothetical protein
MVRIALAESGRTHGSLGTPEGGAGKKDQMGWAAGPAQIERHGSGSVVAGRGTLPPTRSEAARDDARAEKGAGGIIE